MEAKQFLEPNMGMERTEIKPRWINNMKKELPELEEGLKAKYTVIHTHQRSKIPYWDTPGQDTIHGFWFKKFTSTHDRLALEINWCLEETYSNCWSKPKPPWSKYTRNGTTLNNYRPITCLLMIWKIETRQIREEIYYALISCKLFPEEQKRYHTKT